MTDESRADPRALHPAGRRAHLKAVADEPSSDGAFSRITDTELSFIGWMAPLSFDRKTEALKVTLVIDPANPITHRDFQTLRSRNLHVTIAVQAPDATLDPSSSTLDPRVDPVRDAIQTKRINRMIDSWVLPLRTGERATQQGEEWWL